MAEVAMSPMRPYAIALVGAAIVSALAVQRQTARERLELGNRPSSGIVETEMAGIEPPPGPDAAGPDWRAAPSAIAPSASAPTPPPVNGTLEAAAMETFNDARPGLLECLRAERATRSEVAGKLPVVLRVVGPGLVANVDLGPSPVRSETFDECATLTLAQLVFPAGVAPRDLEITYDLR